MVSDQENYQFESQIKQISNYNASSLKKSISNSFASEGEKVDPAQKEKIKRDMQDLYKSQISYAFEDFNKSLKIEDLDLSKISFPTEDVWQNDTFKIVLQDQIRQAMEDFKINQAVAVPAPVIAHEPLQVLLKKNDLEVSQNIFEISIDSIPKAETKR